MQVRISIQRKRKGKTYNRLFVVNLPKESLTKEQLYTLECCKVVDESPEEFEYFMDGLGADYALHSGKGGRLFGCIDFADRPGVQRGINMIVATTIVSPHADLVADALELIAVYLRGEELIKKLSKNKEKPE